MLLWIWNDFMLPLTDPEPVPGDLDPAAVFSTTLRRNIRFNYTMAFTAYLLAMLPMLIIYCMGQKYIVEGSDGRICERVTLRQQEVRKCEKTGSIKSGKWQQPAKKISVTVQSPMSFS